MLQQMRQNTKAILWVVVVAFVVTIFAVWGLDLQTGSTNNDPNIVGRVNGVAISRAQYQYAYRQFAEQIRANTADRSLSVAQERFVREQAWDSIVYGIITEQQIQRLGITVPDQELVDYLRTAPPPEIRQHFVDEQGQFNNQAYQAALNNPEVDWSGLEQLARDRIARIKLNEYLAAQVHVSEEEIRREYQNQATEFALTYVEFPIATADVSDYEPSAEELNEYYNDHRDDFADPERRRVQLVRIPFQPSEKDVGDAAYLADRAREQILAGEDFASLVESYSEAPTSFVGGNTGFITRGQRPDPFFDTLDRTEIGEITDVIVTDEGAYVLKFLERQQSEEGETEYNVQELLVTPVLSRQTSDSLYDIAARVLEQAASDGLDLAAVANGLELLRPGPFAQGAAVDTLGFIPAVSEFAFGHEPEALSTILRDDENLYVAQVMEIIPQSVKPLQDVLETVNQLVLLERRRATAKRDAQAFYRKARATDFGTAVETYELEAKETGTIRPNNAGAPFGPTSSLTEVALAIETGEVSPPVEWRLKFYVAHLTSKSDFNAEDYKTKVAEIKQTLMQRKIQEYSRAWFEALAEEATVEDFRLQG